MCYWVDCVLEDVNDSKLIPSLIILVVLVGLVRYSFESVILNSCGGLLVMFETIDSGRSLTCDALYTTWTLGVVVVGTEEVGEPMLMDSDFEGKNDCCESTTKERKQNIRITAS